jgi:superfamily I DNA/RNA helicase
LPNWGHHPAVVNALVGRGMRPTDSVRSVDGVVPLFTPEAVKGLEFDAVVVVEPAGILGDTARGARLLDVAITRAVHALTLVAVGGPPGVLGAM